MEKGEAIPVMGAFGRPLAADTHLDEDACPGNIDQESGPGDRTMLNVHHLPPYGQGFQPFLAVRYQTVAVFNERVGRARPWEFGVRRARSGVPTLVSRRG